MSFFQTEKLQGNNNNFEIDDQQSSDSFEKITYQLQKIEQDKLKLLREISSYSNENTAPITPEFQELVIMSDISTTFPKEDSDYINSQEKESHLYKKMNQFLLVQDPTSFMNEINEFNSSKKQSKRKYRNAQQLQKKIKKQKQKRQSNEILQFEENQDLIKDLFSEFSVKFDEQPSSFTSAPQLNNNEHSLYDLSNDNENKLFSINNQNLFNNYFDINFFTENILDQSENMQNPIIESNDQKLYQLYNYISVIEKMLEETKKQLFGIDS